MDYASHTRHVEDIEDRLAQALAGITAQAPVVPFYSTVTGAWISEAGVVDGGYWYRNLRQQVGFGPAIAALLEQGHGVFVEVSAHPVLVQPVTELIDTGEVDAVVTGSLRRDDGGPRRLLTSMAELFVRGVALDWTGVLPEPPGGRVDLPTYAFDHKHYWLHVAAAATDAPSLGLAGADHPLLGAVVRAAALRRPGVHLAAGRAQRTRGWPTTPSAASLWSRRPRWSSWPCGPATKPAARSWTS